MPQAFSPDATLPCLWTDGPDAAERLRALTADKAITAAERRDLAHLIEHGWLIWRNAIEPELIDKFVADIANVHRNTGKFLTTDHRNGRSQLIRSRDRPDRFESLFDLYVNLKSARDVCLHPRIVRFLTLVFEAAPVAFQQLLFQRSNGHQVHQDTSVVAVEEAMLLAASWIALEDVRKGAGELAFYDRSHRLPHYLFADGTKRMDFSVDDQAAYSRDLDEACRVRGLAYRKFMAKKGDVLFWTADLVHRSHPRTLPEDTNRRSCVTHYHPATTVPFWFRFHPDKHYVASHGKDAHYVSMHYRLPKGRGYGEPATGEALTG